MPKLPRISAHEVIRKLKKLGFVIVRQRGSHVIMKSQTVGCVIPLHKVIAAGLLKSILRQANVSPEEFENLK